MPPSVPLRVLFSAHGLPETIVRRGDPYQWQIEQTVGAIVAAFEPLDWRICYQSRATPQRWIGPATDAEIERAAHDKVAVLIVPTTQPEDIAETVFWLMNQPPHININTLEIMPVSQSWAGFAVHRPEA